MTEFDMVKAFSEKFLPEEINNHPGFPSKAMLESKLKHLDEEMAELRSAIGEEDLEFFFDSLIDLVYVALGAAACSKLDLNEGFARVHEANMQKVRAVSEGDSKRGSRVDVIKPKDWSPAYLKDLLR